MKKKIIFFSSIVAFILLTTIIYAAYSFTKAPQDDEVELGHIELNTKNFLYYENELAEGEEIELDDSGNNSLYSVLSNIITVYATQKQGYDDELENTIYLNQVGFQFSFSNSIDVYVRLHIEDAWISHKVYNNGTVVENYIRQDANAHPSSFVNDDTWHYDEQTGYFYLKQKVDANTTINNEFNFKTNSTYFYTPIANKNYREAVFVKLSFTVDIVQANRAQAKWGIDVSDIITG